MIGQLGWFCSCGVSKYLCFESDTRFVKVVQGIYQVHSECSRRDQPFLIALCCLRSCLFGCHIEQCQCMAAVLHCDVITYV